MKYIRTKDGRILKDVDCENFSIEDYSNNMNGIYKQADTIEELCDEFISVSSFGKVINNRIENIKILEMEQFTALMTHCMIFLKLKTNSKKLMNNIKSLN